MYGLGVERGSEREVESKRGRGVIRLGHNYRPKSISCLTNWVWGWEGTCRERGGWMGTIFLCIFMPLSTGCPENVYNFLLIYFLSSRRIIWNLTVINLYIERNTFILIPILYGRGIMVRESSTAYLYICKVGVGKNDLF